MPAAKRAKTASAAVAAVAETADTPVKGLQRYFGGTSRGRDTVSPRVATATTTQHLECTAPPRAAPAAAKPPPRAVVEACSVAPSASTGNGKSSVEARGLHRWFGGGEAASAAPSPQPARTSRRAAVRAPTMLKKEAALLATAPSPARSLANERPQKNPAQSRHEPPMLPSPTKAKVKDDGEGQDIGMGPGPLTAELRDTSAGIHDDGPFVEAPVSGCNIVVELPPVAENVRFRRFAGGNWMQYNGLYAARLRQLKPLVLEEARALWGKVVPASSFLESIATCNKVSEGPEVVLVGIVFKEMKSRPSVIERYRNSKGLGRLPEDEEDTEASVGSFCSRADIVWLEDETMRVRLAIRPDRVPKLATGLVVGVRGSPSPEGYFKVTALCFPKALAPLAPSLQVASFPGRAPFCPRQAEEEAPAEYVALISGLAFGTRAADGLAAARERAVDFLVARAPGCVIAPQTGPRSATVRLVLVCGGTFCKSHSPGVKEEGRVSAPAETPSAASPSQSASQLLALALAEADTLFARLAAAVPVEVMPGREDPTNPSLPQMPLHPQLFRRVRASRGALRFVTNPFGRDLEGTSLLGHAGQPVHDLARCTDIATPLDSLALCLQARHLAPTAPDTLAAQPFDDVDPFVIATRPHVLFSGGHSHEAFTWRAVSHCDCDDEGTLCICVPAFHRRQAIILVNLRDRRDVRVEKFDSCSQGGNL